MRWGTGLVALAACGRIGFDPLAGGGAIAGDAGRPNDAGRPGDGAISFGDGITTTMNIMFVTSQQQNAADLLGSDGADAICVDLAYAYGVPGTFVAWISDQSRNARDLVAGSRGWVRTDGLVFAASPAALFAGQIENPPVLDENAFNVGTVPVTTATDTAGNFTGGDCGGWTGPSYYAIAGLSTSTSATWTNNALAECGSNTHLYCFAVDP